MKDDYASYLIRLSQEEVEEGAILWRGELESIQTGQKWQFPDLQSLCQFLQSKTRDNKQGSRKTA